MLTGAIAATGVAIVFLTGARPGAVRADDTARRERALQRARVWIPPAVPIGRANLAANPDVSLRADADLPCTFDVAVVGGLTPKFPCTTNGGERLKVRYGAANPEIPAELAASRLLSSLGFPTDPVYAVRSVQCEGCPAFPFLALRCFRNVHAETACMPLRDREQVRRFTPVLVERRFKGRTIEEADREGWSWDELERIDPALGASRAEVDALRLMAVLLAHWDNKSENQRLICPPGAESPDGECERPLAMISDLGATFGPLKAHLSRWQAVPMWADRAKCEVSLQSLPYRGGTFPRRRISEEGRRLAIELLSQLSTRQLQDLFTGAGFENVPSWVAAFQHKMTQLQSAGPCPTS